MEKLLLFDLDGTLLQSDKTISSETKNTLKLCRNNNLMIGICTARGEINAASFISEINPDITITSGGALAKFNNSCIYKANFTVEETNKIIEAAMQIGNGDYEITIDTEKSHFWNYKIDPLKLDTSWGDSIYTDYTDFNEEALKICVELETEEQAKQIAKIVSDCSFARFSDGNWYTFRKNSATKGKAILEITKQTSIQLDEIIAFGDDYVDIEMLKICGKGIAMGNAIKEVKDIADLVIDTNDNDGIAKYLNQIYDIQI